MKKLFFILFFIISFGETYGSLIVHEVFFDGVKETIVIKNNSVNSFTGEISIIGAKKSPLKLNNLLLTGETYLIIGDDNINNTHYNGTFIGEQGLGLKDSSERKIDLVYSGKIINTFEPGIELINHANKIGTSILYSDLNTQTEKGVNKSNVLLDNGFSFVAVNPIDDDKSNEYISIYANQNYKGELWIKGLGIGDSTKSIQIDAFSGEIYHIGDGKIDEIIGTKLLLNNISLADGGELLSIKGHGGQIIDTTVYTLSDLKEKSLIINTKTSFDKTLNLENDFNVDLSETCYIKLQNKSAFTSTSKINFIGVKNNNEIQNSSNINCRRYGFPNSSLESKKCNPSSIFFQSGGIYTIGLQIIDKEGFTCSSIYQLNLPEINKQNENETISISTLSGDLLSQKKDVDRNIIKIIEVQPNPIGSDSNSEEIRLKNISQTDIANLRLIVNSGKRTKNLTVNLAAGEIKMFSGDLGLYNSSHCFQIESYTGIVFDKVCYPDTKEGRSYGYKSDNDKLVGKEIIELESKEETLQLNENITYHSGFLLNYIIPNPLGKDIDKEEISVTNNGVLDIDIDRLYVKSKSKKVKLGTGKLLKGETRIFKGTFNLYNSASCVRIQNEYYIYKDFCYPKPSEGIKYTTSLPVTSLDKINWINDVSVTFNNNKVCVHIKEDTIGCYDNPLDKKLSSISNKLKKAESKLSKTEKVNKEKFDLLNKKLKQKSDQITLHKEFIYDSNGILKNGWYGLYKDLSLDKRYTTWKVMSKGLQDGSNISYYSSNNITDIYSLKTNILPLHSLDLKKYQLEVFSQTTVFLNTILDNLKL